MTSSSETSLSQNASALRQDGQDILSSCTNARSVPQLPPRPINQYRPTGVMPYSGYGGSTYGSYGGLGSYGSLSSYGSYGGPSSYGSYGMPSMYNSYGGYNSMGMYNMPGVYGGINDDAERRFIQYAEESSRKTFSNVESIVRAFGSIAMMLDNTFFALTSSFRAVLSVAENFGRLRTTFSQIWYSVSVFRFVNWLYRKVLELLGKKPRSPTSAAWNQATKGIPNGVLNEGSSQSSWPTIAFLGILASAPYIISKFLPKYEDKSDMSSWKSPGVPAKAAFDFVGSNPSEMSIALNDDVVIAPLYIQESMKLRNTGWAYALSKGKSGLVPLNYLLLNKSTKKQDPIPVATSNLSRENFLKNFENTNWFSDNPNAPPSEEEVKTKSKAKRVSFGENQIFENIDLDSLRKEADSETKQLKSSLKNSNHNNEQGSDCDKHIS
ncbi:probable peroxisomal membrane protein PEX13 [Coccinella septempunctata]|uniref:probable peroxisomal membrane protein PEX13 n=1 Tax=Coccinella septempunctata TaxID=41139 RepID=UPI001D0639B5|nr:probable peroxisomal membrane protein PEX13 [Coccinella septempunctata]